MTTTRTKQERDDIFEEVKSLIDRRWKEQPDYLEALYIYFRNFAGHMPQFYHIADEALIQTEIQFRNPSSGEKIFADINGFKQMGAGYGEVSMKVANFIEDAYSHIIEEVIDGRIKKLSSDDKEVIDIFAEKLVHRFTRNHTLPSYEPRRREPNQSFIETLELFFPGRGKLCYENLHRVGLLVGANYITLNEKVYHHYFDVLPRWSRDWIYKNYHKTFISPDTETEENKCRMCGREISRDEVRSIAFGYNFHSSCFLKERQKFEGVSTKDPAETEILHDFLAAHVLEFIEIPDTEVNVGEQYKIGHPTIGRKLIDVVGRTPEGVWILEIERELTGGAAFNAVGQVIIYSYLYENDHPGLKKENLRMGIVCGGAEKEVIAACREKNIKVFYSWSY